MGLKPNCASCDAISWARSSDFASTVSMSGPQPMIFIPEQRQNSRASGSQEGFSFLTGMRMANAVAGTSRLIPRDFRARRHIHRPSCFFAPAPITRRGISFIEYHLKAFKARPLDPDRFRRVANPEIAKRRGRIMSAFQRDDEMVGVSNRHGNFPYSDVKRSYPWIESSLRDHGAIAPQKVNREARDEDNCTR